MVRTYGKTHTHTHIWEYIEYMAFPYSSSPSLQPQPCCCGTVQSWASNSAARTTTRLPGMEAYAAFCCSLDVYWGSLRESLSFPEVGGDKLTTQIVSHCGLDFSEKIMNPPPFLPCLDRDWKQPHSSAQHGLPSVLPAPQGILLRAPGSVSCQGSASP